MAADEISARINIDGGKEAVKELQAVGKEAKKLDGTTVEIPVEADTRKVDRDIEGLLKKVNRLDKDPATLLLTSNATAIAGDIADLIIDLDRLDAEDPEVTVKTDQINTLQGDLDRVEAKIKEVNSTPVDIDTRPAQQGIKDVGKSADSSKSVLANMVGNATQDLGALGGVAGSAGVAIGQMGEYMADAKSSGEGMGSVLRSFAGVAGPIAAISLATALIGKRMEAIAETKAFNTKRVDAYVDALEDAQVTASELLDVLNEDKATGIFARVNEETVDLDRSVAKTLGTFEQFQAVLADPRGVEKYADSILASADNANLSAQEHRELEAAIRASLDGEVDGVTILKARNAGYEDEIKTLIALSAARGTATDGLDEAAFREKFYGDAVDETTDSTDKAAKSQRAVNTALESSAATADRYITRLQEERDLLQGIADAAQEQADALNASIDAAAAAADSNVAMADAQNDFVDAAHATIAAEKELADAKAKHGKSSKEAQDASDDLKRAVEAERDSMITAAKAAQRLADDQAAAAGKTQSAVSKVDTLNESLIANASFATPAARKAVYEYLITLNQIEPTKATEILAHVDAGDLATANALLNGASKTRTAAINADAFNTVATDKELDDLANPNGKARTAKINVALYGASALSVLRNPAHAHGGRVGREGGIAGEAGPEFIRLPGSRRTVLLTGESYVPPGTQVTSTRRTREILQRRRLPRFARGTMPSSSGPSTVNVSISAGVIGNRYDVMRVVKQATRDHLRLLGTRS